MILSFSILILIFPSIENIYALTDIEIAKSLSKLAIQDALEGLDFDEFDTLQAKNLRAFGGGVIGSLEDFRASEISLEKKTETVDECMKEVENKDPTVYRMKFGEFLDKYSNDYGQCLTNKIFEKEVFHVASVILNSTKIIESNVNQTKSIAEKMSMIVNATNNTLTNSTKQLAVITNLTETNQNLLTEYQNVLEKNQEVTTDLESSVTSIESISTASLSKIDEIKSDNFRSLIITLVFGFALFVAALVIDRKILLKQ